MATRVKSRLRSTNYANIVSNLSSTSAAVTAAEKTAPAIIAQVKGGTALSAAVQTTLGVSLSYLQSRPGSQTSAAEKIFARQVLTLVNAGLGTQTTAAIGTDAGGKLVFKPAVAKVQPTAPGSSTVTQTRSGATAVAAGAASKLPWVIGGVAVLGGAVLLLRKRK